MRRSALTRATTPARSRKTILSVMVLAAMLGTACSSTGSKEDPFTGYNEAFARGDYAAAASALKSDDSEDQKKGSSERKVLQLLHIAEAQRLSGDYQGAIDSYNDAEAGLKAIDLEGKGEKAMEGVASFAGKSGDYEPYEAEKILINTYKALAYLSLGDADGAGVEFRRSTQRAEDSVESFKKEIAAAESSEIEIPGKGSFSLKNLIPKQARDTIERNRKNLGSSDEDGIATFSGYEGFMVPAARYLHGMYELSSDNGSPVTAESAYRAVSEMYDYHEEDVSDVDHAREDFFLSELDDSKKGELKGQHVWVVYENGQAPGLVAKGDDIDLTVDTESIDLYVRGVNEDPSAWKNKVQDEGRIPYRLTYALPVPQDPVNAGQLSIMAAGKSQPLTTFSSMQSVSITELDRRYPAIATKAFATSAVKVVAQAMAAKKAEASGAGFGGLAARVAGNASAATTFADTRSWRSLPSHWEVAHFQRPADNTVLVGNKGIKLPNWSRTLIYVKRPTESSPLHMSVIDMSGKELAIETGL